jgi:hypothetical protein
MEDVLKQLKAIQQNHLPSQLGIHSLHIPASQSSSMRSVHHTLNSIPKAYNPSDYYDHPNSNVCSSRLSRNPQPCGLKSYTNVVHPHKTLEITQSQYSCPASMRTLSEYPQYSTPTEKTVHCNRRTPQRETRERVILQRRQNAEELNYSVSCPYSMTLQENSPSSPKFDKQYSDMIPCKTTSIRSCPKLNSPKTPYNTPREYLRKSHHLFSEEKKSAFRNIDTDLSSDLSILTKNNGGDTATMLKTKIIPISTIRPGIAEFDRTVPSQCLNFKVDENCVHFHSNLNRNEKNSSIATFK